MSLSIKLGTSERQVVPPECKHPVKYGDKLEPCYTYTKDTASEEQGTMVVNGIRSSEKQRVDRI